MGDPTSDLGITWEQIAIAAICFLVLIVVLVLALRGLSGGRRKARLLRETSREPVYRPRTSSSASRSERRAERRMAPVGDDRRMEPSLMRSEPTIEDYDVDDVPPSDEVEHGYEASALEQHLAYLSETQADMARTLKALKAQVDELRKAEAQSNQRLDETEQLLSQLHAESHKAFALLETLAGQSATGAAAPDARAPRRKRRSDPSLPLDIPPAGQDAEETDEDPTVARTRQALEGLARQDRRQS